MDSLTCLHVNWRKGSWDVVDEVGFLEPSHSPTLFCKGVSPWKVRKAYWAKKYSCACKLSGWKSLSEKQKVRLADLADLADLRLVRRIRKTPFRTRVYDMFTMCYQMVHIISIEDAAFSWNWGTYEIDSLQTVICRGRHEECRFGYHKLIKALMNGRGEMVLMHERSQLQ